VERFSEPANRVVEEAQNEVRRLGHPYVGTEHLLLGLISVDSPTSDALAAAGATADSARDKVAEAVGRGSNGTPRDPQFSDRARRALDRASRLSLNRRDPLVEPAHILTAVLDVEGRAGQVLRGLGIDVAKLRDAVDPSVARAPLAEGPVTGDSTSVRSPQCGGCGMSLDGRLSYRVMGADGDGERREFVVAYCASCGTAVGAVGG
jgi:ATP-dependent Clp protease ATP-binding subunit ClpA